jgi:hypothetical protein
MKMRWPLGVALLLGCALASTALDNGLNAKPALGFNTWNAFYRDIHEDLVKEQADLMVSLGLRDAGYEYLVLDDCWAERPREKGEQLRADSEKFPSGMKAMGDYIHGKGLKYGIYSDAGTLTCAKYPGSLDHEQLDAQTFAGWGGWRPPATGRSAGGCAERGGSCTLLVWLGAEPQRLRKMIAGWRLTGLSRGWGQGRGWGCCTSRGRCVSRGCGRSRNHQHRPTPAPAPWQHASMQAWTT